MKGKRTGIDFSKHIVDITRTDLVVIHWIHIPGKSENNVKFINTQGILSVTGDFGEWIFRRSFQPDADNYVSDEYWKEKLPEYIDCEDFDTKETEKAIQAFIDHGAQEYGYEGQKLITVTNFFEQCKHYLSESESDYKEYAYTETPRGMDAETIPYCKKTKPWLQYVFDAFDEICRRYKTGELTEDQQAPKITDFTTLNIELRNLIKSKTTFVEMCKMEKDKGNIHYWMKTETDRKIAIATVMEAEEAIKILSEITTWYNKQISDPATIAFILRRMNGEILEKQLKDLCYFKFEPTLDTQDFHDQIDNIFWGQHDLSDFKHEVLELFRKTIRILDEDVIAIANYGNRYRDIAKNAKEVPAGNAVQWWLWYKENKGKPKKEKSLDDPFEPDWRSHPLDTIIESAMVKKIDFATMAEYLKMDLTMLREFLAERISIDQELATNLERLLGPHKAFWIKRQEQYDQPILK